MIYNTLFKKNLLIFLILFGVLGLAKSSLAANHYVRADATGANNGSDWTNAWTSFPSGASWIRGDTYYVAGGAYTGNITITAPESDSSWIIIKKANTADNGSDAGWDASYATTQAVIVGGFSIGNNTGYFEIDGVTGSGTSGHGIKVTREGLSAGNVFSFGAGTGSVNPRHVYHVEIKGYGHQADTSSSGLYWNITTTGTKGLHVQHCWIHEASCNGITVGKAVGTSYTDYGMLVEDSVISEINGSGCDGQGAQMSYGQANAYTIFRRNIFRNIYSTAYITFMDGSANNTYSRIYNNIFYNNDPDQGIANYHTVGSLIRGLDLAAETSYIEFYNNTIYNIQSSRLLNLSTIKTGCVAYNNFWEGPRLTVYGTHVWNTVGYNGYYNIDGSGGPSATETSSPFVNAAGADFHLKAGANAIGNGTNLSSIFATDIEGTTRSAWDIGAYEYVSAAPPPDTTPPSAPTGLLVQ